MAVLSTPDGRYFVVRGRLWRLSNPSLPEEKRTQLVKQLMQARRDVKTAMQSQDPILLKAARAKVQEAKVALGERGAPWWQDGAPDYNRYLVKNTPYAQWFAMTSQRDEGES